MNEENVIRICPVCERQFAKEDILFDFDFHGISFRSVCFECYENLMEKGYDE